MDIPIAKNLNDLKIHLNDAGQVVVKERGAGLLAFGGPDLKWHFSKQYGPLIYTEQCGLILAWSHNGFATFALDLLSRLEGTAPRRAGTYMFGQVFDAIQPESRAPA
ncbi:MAG: hypothetical protein L0211_09790 [Planctomycetaceae bacterium]|nr:hypothetical protein [Planctomycetaceae bacterium]